MAKYPLGFKGGWMGLGTSLLDTNSPSIIEGASFSVINWQETVTLRNLVVKHATTAMTGCGAAVCVKTAGSIKLDQVWVNAGITLHGAELDNRASVSSRPGSVTVTNSQFREIMALDCLYSQTMPSCSKI